MNRRSYLSAAGLVLFAGCATSDSTETTRTPTPVPTTTATPTATTATTATPTATPAETPTPEPTTEETPEPDRVDRVLNLAVEDLDATVEAFGAVAGPDGGFHDLDASMRFSFDDVDEPLYRARDHLDTLDQLSKRDDQRARLARLRRVYWFLWWTAKTHEYLNLTYYRAQNAVSRFYDGEYDRIDAQAAQMTEELDLANETFDRLTRESDAESFAEITELGPADYDEKVAHFETETEQFAWFAELLPSFRDAIRQLRRGFDAYLGGDYADASGRFFLAARGFEDVVAAVADVDAVVALRARLEEFTCIADALARGSDFLDEAATAGDFDYPDKQVAVEGEAESAFATCELVETKVTVVGEFFAALAERRA